MSCGGSTNEEATIADPYIDDPALLSSAGPSTSHSACAENEVRVQGQNPLPGSCPVWKCFMYA